MKVLVVGKGGREHALVQAIARSPTATEIYAFPGSDAICEIARPVEADGVRSLVRFMVSEGIGLCIAGEESYLLRDEGLANECAASGIACWGPVKISAQLEGSKAFAKDFMIRHGIPTGAYTRAGTVAAAREAITRYPCVLKFDGLAAGKGVAVCPDEPSAFTFIDEVLGERKFGQGDLLVEEFLEGPEISIFASVVDGDYQILAPARDYKRIGDGDRGPNTGGMGAVASRAGLLDAGVLRQIEELAVRPTVEGLDVDGMPYRGFLYFGLMLTGDGPKLLEYNCRFGDPEAEAVMPLIRGDFAGYLESAANGHLRPDLISFDDGWSVCVISASAGYPTTSRSGDPISGLDAVEDVQVYHAGTRKTPAGEFVTHGGRVLAVVAQGATRETALEKVYSQSAKITFDGLQRRSDIGRLHFE